MAISKCALLTLLFCFQAMCMELDSVSSFSPRAELYDLPKEMIYNIALYLPMKEQVRLKFVCKTMNEYICWDKFSPDDAKGMIFDICRKGTADQLHSLINESKYLSIPINRIAFFNKLSIPFVCSDSGIIVRENVADSINSLLQLYRIPDAKFYALPLSPGEHLENLSLVHLASMHSNYGVAVALLKDGVIVTQSEKVDYRVSLSQIKAWWSNCSLKKKFLVAATPLFLVVFLCLLVKQACFRAKS